MAESFPTQFHDLAALAEVSAARWRDLCEAFEYPAGATKKNVCGAKIHELLVAHVDFSPELLEALDLIYRLGTDEGREQLLDTARSLNIAVAAADDEGPRDLAARLCVERKRHGEIQKLLDHANMVAISRGPRRTYKEFHGAVGAELRQGQGPLREALEKEIADWCGRSGRSAHCRVRIYEGEDELVFYIVHGHRLEAPAVLNEGRHEVLKFRRLQNDFVKYEQSTGRLYVTAASAQFVGFYQRLFGRALFDAEEGFAGEPTCDLTVIQEGGQAALDRHHVNGIIAVRLVKATMRTPLGGTHEVTSRGGADCFEEMELTGFRRESGQLIAATLAVDLNAKRGQRKVRLQPPRTFAVPQDETAPLIHEYLRQVGITRPPPAPRNDLWTLTPGSYPVKVWEAALGAEQVERLRRDAVLLNAQLRMTTSPDDPHAGDALQVLDAGDGEFIGVSEDQELPTRVLTSTDTSGLDLDVERYAATLASALELIGARGKLGVDGIIELGERALGSRKIRVLLLARAGVPLQFITSRIEAGRRGGRDPVLLLPVGRELGTGITEVSFKWRHLDGHDLIRDIIYALGMAATMPANLVSPPTARLVIDLQLKQVWLDRVQLPIAADTHPYKYLVALAENHGRPVSKAEMQTLLSASGFDENVVKKAKYDLKKSIKKAFLDAGLDAPDLAELLPRGRGEYALGVEPFVWPPPESNEMVASESPTVA